MIQYDPDWKKPWWTSGAISYVEGFLAARPMARVFEFGSGMSSRWLAERCGYLHTVESKMEWVKRVSEHLERFKYARVSFLLGKEYCQSIERERGKFDVVIIDGDTKTRYATVIHSIPKISFGGIMVVDDAQAEVLRPIQMMLRGWKSHSFITDGHDRQHEGKVTRVYVKAYSS